MAGIASCSSSAATAAFPKKSYDVFISFRGEDTRRNFTSHLYASLGRNQIQTYKDDTSLEKGDEVWSSLVHAINSSYLCIVVFSKHYAASTWCLRELTHILECKKEKEVIPVFYQTDPSHVRKQTGSYKDAFDEYEKNFELDKQTIKKWKAALQKAANFSGFDSESKEYRNENQFIENIVKDVWQKLEHIYPESEPKNLVGIDKILADMNPLLSKFQSIGLWGMGGIGKTTMAKVIFHRHSSQYESHCFLENVREKSGNQALGFYGLRKKLLSELLKGENIHTGVESAFVKSRLRYKTVLIVLDDVDTPDQIEYLLGEISCFGPGSKIIITTRDRRVLNRRVDKIYKVEGLDFQESLQLFSLNAFSRKHPQIEFEELSEKLISYAEGLPLALKLLGSYLHSRSKEAWESALQKLKKYPHKSIENVLKLSYDGLEEEEKEIFLDIAFFFKGEKREDIENFLNACDVSATIGLEILQDKALITILNDGRVIMHALVQEMGWERVREKCVKDPGGRSRLRNSKEVYDVLKNNMGSDAVEGIILDLSTIDDLHLSGDAFKKMTKLRFLKFHFPFWYSTRRKSKVYPSGLESFSDSLRYFHWDAYPSESLPPTLCVENLVEFYIRDSHIKIFGDGAQDFTNLKKIHLDGCHQLMELPNFPKALNLESLHLSCCINLRHVPTICVEKLVHLVLAELGMKKCWDGVQDLVNLKTFVLYGCPELIELPDLSKASKLEIAGTGMCMNLCHVHPSLLALHSLRDLHLWGCKNLNSLQSVTLSNNLEDFSLNLPNIRELHLSITATKTLPSSIGGCINLQWLYINDSPLESLPSCIKHLSSLLLLDISNCKRLRYVPELPPSLIILYAENCTSLETVITPTTLKFGMDVQMSSVWRPEIGMLLTNCLNLDESSLHAIVIDAYKRIKLAACQYVRFLETDEHSEYHYTAFCFPGNRVPWWIRYEKMGRWISIELPPRSHLLGFTFCIIFSPELSSYEQEEDSCSLKRGIGCKCYLHDNVIVEPDEDSCSLKIEIGCKCYLDDSVIVTRGYTLCCPHDERRIYLSDHVIMWYDETDGKDIMEAIRDTPREHSSYNSKLSFEFVAFVEDYESGWELNVNNAIKKCGVWPIYASEEMKVSLESGIGNKTKRCRDMDDHQLLQRKKFNGCEDIDEFLGSSTSGIGVGGYEFDHINRYEMQPLIQTNILNEFVFQPRPIDISVPNALLDSTQMNSTCLLDRFGEVGNSTMQFGPAGICAEFNRMATCGNSLGATADQQSTNLSLLLNEGSGQMNPLDIVVNSGEYISSSSSGLPEIVQLAQANAFGSTSLSNFEMPSQFHKCNG